ncbi:hypothetical protein G0Q06_11700 [Puniceicoccales bacterium CK1056]|uniref:SCP domain-containing protein n=1 Tax=Oceanipulchritudo coccoides TaxID=2706888 RepID=A0A6B2M4G7_9BACT|nr:CAP domain-containing protein [Oceanipulchritudo coccoides]NDV63119.1 hypothetical protein [Oceanipulchritudo coccoides]
MNFKNLPIICLLIPIATGQLSGSPVDPDNRWQMRDYFNAVYQYGSNFEMEWTGNYGSGRAGSLSADWQEATLNRINFYREMAGVPSDVVFDPVLSEKSQKSAFMMSANNNYSHTPPSNWLYWSQDAYDAAYNGNLALGSTGIDSIRGYMSDYGSNNKAVGHRRWILYPNTSVMGSGDVPGTDPSTRPASNVLWVIPQTFGERPETRDEFVAWPPRGYVPSELVYSRWSFSHPDADFSNATVSMVSNGQSVPVRIDSRQNGYGDNTIVWIPNGMSTSGFVTWPTPASDQPVEVTVNSVRINGVTRSFTYTVTIFDPDNAGSGEFHSTGYPVGPVLVDYPSEFAVSSRPFAEGVQGRVIEAEPYTTVLDAEDGFQPFEADTSGGYSIVQNGRRANGHSAYQLANPDATTQTLTHPDTFIVKDGQPRLYFNSSLAWATSDQVARVEINAGSSENWQEIWRLTGLVQSNNDFTSETLDLSEWSGKTVRIRFRYSLEGTSYYAGSSSNSGWVIDDISLSGVDRVAEIDELPAQMGTNSLHITFDSNEPAFLQTRDFAFGGFPLDWGPIVEVEPVTYSGIENSNTGNWEWDPVFGYNQQLDLDWTYASALGWINTDNFPWVCTTSGWFRYMHGSVDKGLWLYSPEWGFVYTDSGMSERFRYAPFTSESSSSFGN